jgi:hypothetical protein
MQQPCTHAATSFDAQLVQTGEAAGSKIWQRGAVMPDCLAPLPAATDLAAAISACLQSKTAPAQEVTDTAQKPGGPPKTHPF